MILVNDPYDLVPELFEAFPEFAKSTQSDVDILPTLCPESFEPSQKLTIFIQPEPDIHRADQYYLEQIKSKPNALWAVSGHGKDNQWQLSRWFEYFANLTSTVRVNPELPALDLGPKPWLATALLGGWMPNRGLLLDGLKQQGLISQCLVNYSERDHDPVERRNRLQSQNSKLYFNMRTPELNQLDNSEFQRMAFTKTAFDERQTFALDTCQPIPNSKTYQHSWISQLVPRNIYNSAYISIVAETENMFDTFFISEKISRPLLAGHPFLIFGCHGYLQYLRELGFKTFSPWIDESYDLVYGTGPRIKAIVNSVKQFAQLTDLQKQQACREMQSVVEHNRQLVKNYRWSFGPIADAIHQHLDLKPA